MMNLLVMAQLFSITMPVEREDSTPLYHDEIAELRAYCGYTSGDYQQTYKMNALIFPETVMDVGLPIGSNYCVFTVVDTDGRESRYTDEFEVIPSKPPVVSCEPNADLNGDGIVNAADLVIMKTKFFKPF